MPRTVLQEFGTGALAFAIMIAIGVTLPSAAYAQQKPTPSGKKSAEKKNAKPKRLSRKQAEAELRDGYKALQAKEAKQAIAALTRALDAGSLQRKEMAKALYYRGIAYRTSDRAAKAISDLTSSLWLKGALTKKERADALKQRKLAYSSAGIGGGLLSAPSSSSSVAVTPETNARSTKPSAKQPKPKEKTKSSDAGSWKSTTNAKPLPKTTGSTSSSSAGNPVAGVTSFFSNLFTPSSQSTGQSQSQTATLSKPSPGASSTSVSSWSSKKKKKAPSTTTRAAARPAAKAKPAKPAGNYQIQVASYRSRSRADAVVRRITKNFGGLLSGRKPVVEANVVTGMGQFYQVRIKRYRNAREPATLCKKLIAGGLDCFVRRGK